MIDPPHILGPSTVLGPGGTIARTLPGYEARHQQLKMAEAVAHQVPRPDRRGRRLTAPGRPTRPVAALPGDRPESHVQGRESLPRAIRAACRDDPGQAAVWKLRGPALEQLSLAPDDVLVAVRPTAASSPSSTPGS
ncbi:MAG: hypothetical protein JO252_18210 [Planctomycetaceae bacterium]|nr:hypothetical protein [Planctomycetaceae bacterium]